MILALCSNPLSAATINLSFDPDDWNIAMPAYEANDATFTNTGGNLLGTLVNSHPGSGSRVSRTSAATYNFQDATLEYKWRVNGQGTYSAFTTGTRSTYYFDPNGQVAGYYTTQWSFNGSEIINHNQWIYTRVNFTETDYSYAMSYSGYGNNAFIQGSTAMLAGRWSALASDTFYFSLGDNYGAGAYIEFDEIRIITPDSGNPAVPEPATMLLFGTGIAGLAAVGRRRTQ